ncbi:S-layer homology domain-containing protein [Candidatus Gottesmanbacteria bacterium]|nr:S-layer homology domain-containing protein [Candidatus Gottesmanbacteria bacterium]
MAIKYLKKIIFQLKRFIPADKKQLRILLAVFILVIILIGITAGTLLAQKSSDFRSFARGGNPRPTRPPKIPLEEPTSTPTVTPIPTLPYTVIFNDVPETMLEARFIEQVYRYGIITSCSTSPDFNFCPDGTVTRAQMAVYLLAGKHVKGYAPPNPPTGNMFTMSLRLTGLPAGLKS